MLLLLLLLLLSDQFARVFCGLGALEAIVAAIHGHTSLGNPKAVTKLAIFRFTRPRRVFLKKWEGQTRCVRRRL